ncbi:MAG: RidA family protein [Janthinobacterium lividum]
MEKQTTRRGLLKNAAAAAAGVTGVAALAPAEAEAQSSIVWEKKIIRRAPAAAAPGEKQTPTPATPTAAAKPPLFNGIVTFGNLVFIAGIGAHFKGTIEEHTKHVLDEIEENLKLAGSSMEKVLKVNVYLADLKYYAGMNSVYQGRFGAEPGVRTTVAVAGVPGDSLVEIDCIASL